MQILNIPEERKAVLIGKKGADKKRIEKLTHTRITVGDDITIEGNPLDSLRAEEVVKAVGRGFSPKIALKLVDEEYSLLMIKLTETKNSTKRLLGRVIGQKGKAKKYIEELTNTNLSVYGKTISIVGKYKDAEDAEKSVRLLLKGKTHKYAYSHLKTNL